MSKRIIIKGQKGTFYNCKDCHPTPGKVKRSFRPNGKFCDPVCRCYVAGAKSGGTESGSPLARFSVSERREIEARLTRIESAISKIEYALKLNKGQ